ncbi:hypothetical protein SH139x_004791 [Planctomycetaceae bacterium SH139]
MKSQNGMGIEPRFDGEQWEPHDVHLNNALCILADPCLGLRSNRCTFVSPTAEYGLRCIEIERFAKKPATNNAMDVRTGKV